MQNILVVGSSGHAKVVIDIVQAENRYEIVGLIDDFRKPGESTLGYPVLGGENDLIRVVTEHRASGFLIAIGDNFARATVARTVGRLCPGLPLVTAVHPRAYVAASAFVGPGTVLMAGASVGASCTIGSCCILNTNSSLDHDSTMSDYASLAPNSATGGNCAVGTHAAIGIGASIAHNIEIGEHTIIGAGSTVLHNIKGYVVAYGTPAKVVRPRSAGEHYL